MGFCIILYLRLLSQAEQEEKEKNRKETRKKEDRQEERERREEKQGGKEKEGREREREVFPTLRVSRQTWLVCSSIVKINILIF